jgi:hypothetical protein
MIALWDIYTLQYHVGSPEPKIIEFSLKASFKKIKGRIKKIIINNTSNLCFFKKLISPSTKKDF